MRFSAAYHLQTNVQSERTIQTLEDMLRACVLDFKSSWDKHISSIEFAYSKVMQIGPYEAFMVANYSGQIAYCAE